MQNCICFVEIIIWLKDAIKQKLNIADTELTEWTAEKIGVGKGFLSVMAKICVGLSLMYFYCATKILAGV